MKYRALDASGDMQGIRTVSGHLEGARAVAAAVRSRLLSFEGEWWEFLDDGIPFEAMVGRLDEEQLQIAEALIRVRVAETEGVENIEKFEVVDSGTTRTVTMTIVTGTDADLEEIEIEVSL